MENNRNFYPEDERQVIEVDWKTVFTEEVLDQARTSTRLKIAAFQVSSDQRGFTAVVREGLSRYEVRASRFPREEGENFRGAVFRCSCQRYSFYAFKCAHIAKAMYHAQMVMGPFTVLEDSFSWERRKEENRRKREGRRRLQALSSEECVTIPALGLFRDLVNRQNRKNSAIFFDFERQIADCTSNTVYRDWLAKGECPIEYYWKWDSPDHFAVSRDEKGNRVLEGSGFSREGEDRREVRLRIGSDGTFECGCGCTFAELRKKQGFQKELCPHQLQLLRAAWEDALEYSDVSTTTRGGRNFLALMDKNAAVARKAEAEVIQVRTQDIRIVPRIVRDGGSVSLSFMVGRTGGRLYILKSYEKLIEAERNSLVLNLGKNADLDFAAETLTDESLPWLTFIQRKSGEIDQVNERLSRRTAYTPGVPLTYQQELRGATLDRFYDEAEGTVCIFRDRNDAKDSTVRIGHKSIRIRMHIARIADARNRFAGIRVTGRIPIFLPGSSARYCLSDTHLSRLEEDEERAVLPFAELSEPSGSFAFEIGLGDLREFYYRALPELTASPYVDVEDLCEEEAVLVLPPEAKFRFFMDYEGDCLLMDCDVSYEREVRDWKDVKSTDRQYRIVGAAGEGEDMDPFRDRRQEERVRGLIGELGFVYDPVNGHYTRGADQEGLYDFIRNEMPRFFSFGLVHGTDRFMARRIRSVPQIRAGVSIESDLMNLSITTKDMDTRDLMDILAGYRRKKKYHVLRNGEFVSLDRNKDLDALADLMEGLGLTEKDFRGDRASLPVYRALYLDKLLEDHENIVSSGDKVYRNLLRSYRTIRDSDYEVPACMTDTLRPYQVFGYKWMRTLKDTGFGGILADEMGLGKTLQTIACFQAGKEAGNEKPSLVVCPASLVYNWEAEILRFAPDLAVTVLAGPQQTRRKLLSDSLAAGNTDVFVTSYDLMKRDISSYQKAFFDTCVLDEAQYIKNQKAAVTRSVKTIHADHRFALTGTPIENRLAELWSIFDFLMPGFLNTYEDFSRRFDIPITKNRDEKAADHLKKLTGPFILRRLKADVLKDLPPRLEEVRYARFDDLQQKIYDGQVARIQDILDGGLVTGQDKMKLLSELTRARQICCDPSLILENYKGASAKREACLDLIKSAIDGEHRMLVFSQFTSMLSLLEEDLEAEHIPYYKITGSTPKEQRIKLVNAFNDGDGSGDLVPVFLISLKAGGTGLNLTGADMVIHYDPWWNLAAQNQATDRAHRIGQEKQVTVYRMIARGTIEEKILDLQEQKKYLADAILEGRSESIMNMSAEELRALMI